MKSEIIKSRLEIVKYGFGVAFCLLLILLNLIGLTSDIYQSFDRVINPFVVNTRQFGLNADIFFREVTSKSNILDQNILLKRQVSELESMKAENEELKKKLSELESKSCLSIQNDRKYSLLRIRGIQNLYSIAPFILIELQGKDQVRIGEAVYYDKNQLFGFVQEINGLTAKIIPFYAPGQKFNIPVQNSKDINQKGFISPIEQGIVKIKNVSKNASVGKGDIWVTTNDRAEVPSGLVVGKVKAVFEDTEKGFKELELEPPFDLLKLEYLLIENDE